MRVACILLDHLPARVEARRRPDPERPLLIVQTTSSRKTVIDFSPGLRGLQSGMPLQEALARAPGALPVEADIPHCESIFDRILDALRQRSPGVEVEGLGMAYVDLTGLEAMYGGEASLVIALEQAIPPTFAPRLGVANGKFPAYVAAQRARPGHPVAVPQDVAHFLAAMPVDLLPISWEVRERLRGFGLTTLGDLASRPVGPLQAQFGPEGRLAWHLARGEDPRPLMPRRTEETITEWLSFPTPVSFLEPILVAVETLLGRAFARLERRGRAVRQATLQAQIFRCASWTRPVSFRQPLSDKDRAIVVVKRVLEDVRFPGPLEDFGVTLSRLTGEAGRQESLFSHVRRREQLREAMRQLQVELGKQPPIYYVREVEPWSRIPERRQALVPYAP